MNRKKIYLTILAVSILLISFWIIKRNQPIIPVKNVTPDLKASIGSKDDPYARMRWEQLRIQDPKTGKVPEQIRIKELQFAQTIPTRQQFTQSVYSIQTNTATNMPLDWTRRGPFNVGGRTRALALDATNEKVLLAGGVSGGMWRSTNDGNSWTKVTVSSDLHSVTCIAQDTRPNKTNVWYYGTGEFWGNSATDESGKAPYGGDGIYKSTDNGLSWQQLPATVSGTPNEIDPFDFVWNIITDSSNHTEDEVYAAILGGIRRTTDGGNSWQWVVGGQTPYSDFVDVAITSTGVVYATLSRESTARGIWRSVDGDQWVNITPANWPSYYRRTVIGIAPSNENVVYFLADTPGSGVLDHNFWKYTYRSGDGTGNGGFWENLSVNIPAFGGYVGDYNSQYSYNMLVQIKPDNENVIFLGGTNLYRSTDGFRTSTNTKLIGGYASPYNTSNYPNQHADQHALVFLPSNPRVMFAGHDGGISKTLDNLASRVEWTSLNNGYFTTQFYTVAIDHATDNNDIIVGGMQDNSTWFTNSQVDREDWIDVFPYGDGSYCAIADGRTFYYFSAQYAWIYRMKIDENGNETGQMARVDPEGVDENEYLFVNPFILDRNNSKIMYLAAGNRIWRNDDLTQIPPSYYPTRVNWVTLNTTTTSGCRISALEVSKTPANILYYGTHNGRIFRLENVHLNNAAPVDVWSGKGLPIYAYVSCLAVNPNDANEILAIFSNYNIPSIFYSNNGGTTWTDVSGNLEENPDGSGVGPSIRWGEIVPYNGTTFYFVGASTGLYSTTALDGAQTQWIQEGAESVGNVVVDMIDSRPSDGTVVIGTHGQGVFSSRLTPDNPDLKPPQNLTAMVAGDTVRLSWKAPANNGTVLNFNHVGNTPKILKVPARQLVAVPLSGSFLPAKTIAQTTINEIEPNNTLEQAQQLSGESPIEVKGSAVIVDSGEVQILYDDSSADDLEDLYLIKLKAPGLKIELTDFSSDCDLYLLNFDASDLIEYSNVTGATASEEIELSDLSADNYLVGVSIFDLDPRGDSTTVYSLTLTGAFEETYPPNLVQAYQIYRSVSSPVRVLESNRIGKVMSDTTTFIDLMGPFSSLNYYYVVTALYEAGESGPSNEVQVGLGLTNGARAFSEAAEATALPTHYELAQNYPNPFNPTTTIRFALPEAGPVKITVYSVLGRKLVDVVDQHYPAGFHQIRFNAQNLASGLYFYKIETEKFRQMKRMVFMK